MIKIALIFCTVLFFTNFVILESYQTHVSSPVITSDKTDYKQGENIVISGWVNYNEEPTSDVLLKIVATSPIEIKIFDEYVTSDYDGRFSVEIPIPENAETGIYSVEITSQCREVHREICTHKNEKILITIEKEPNQNKKIPTWIKNTAEWWSQNLISDDEFLEGIQHLVDNRIIVIDAKTSQTKTASMPFVPSWIKDMSGWWASGEVSDKDFVNGLTWLIENGVITVEDEDNQLEIECMGDARCIAGTVTRVIDGDTIKVDGQSIRFALSSAPEMDEPDGIKAKNFVQTLCPVGTKAVVDEDDGQTLGSYGRILGVVYCNGLNLNEELLDSGLGYLSSGFCNSSEFTNEYWAQKYGCGASQEPEQTRNTPKTMQSAESCDPSYPDFCISPPPPDLDCGDILQKRFTVLQPDPHRFDGDKDGIGCES